MLSVRLKHLKQSWALPFFTIWTGQSFSLLGSSLVQFALIWWLTKTTGSATVLATASFVGFAPQVLLGPIAGAMVDRWSRRVMLIISDAVIALAVVVLAILFWLGLVEIWHLYILMFIRSIGGAFHWPAMQASTSLMVPKEHLSRVQGLNSTLNGALNIASAPLGALLLELLPMQGVLAIDVGTALLAVLPLFFIAIPQPKHSGSTGDITAKTTLWQDLRAGFAYVWAWPGLVILLLLATIINLVLNPGFVLLPLLVSQHFGGEAMQLAWMESAWGIGVVVGGLLLSVWGGFRRRILTSMLGLTLIGLGSIGIGLAPSSALFLGIAGMLVMGFGNPITNGPIMAVLQAVVAPEMQGRVFTLVTSVAGGMTPLGILLAGPLADRFGVQTWFLAGGIITIFLGITGVFVPAVVNIEEGRATQADIRPEPEDGSEVSVMNSPAD